MEEKADNSCPILLTLTSLLVLCVAAVDVLLATADEY
jgi:hypothetical protein